MESLCAPLSTPSTELNCTTRIFPGNVGNNELFLLDCFWKVRSDYNFSEKMDETSQAFFATAFATLRRGRRDYHRAQLGIRN
jgi:hypothetical protein